MKRFSGLMAVLLALTACAGSGTKGKRPGPSGPSNPPQGPVDPTDGTIVLPKSGMSVSSKLGKTIVRESNAKVAYDNKIEFDTANPAINNAAKTMLQKAVAAAARNGVITITGTNIDGSGVATKSLGDVNSKLGATDKWDSKTAVAASATQTYAQLKEAALANLQAWVNNRVDAYNATIIDAWGSTYGINADGKATANDSAVGCAVKENCYKFAGTGIFQDAQGVYIGADNTGKRILSKAQMNANGFQYSSGNGAWLAQSSGALGIYMSNLHQIYLDGLDKIPDSEKAAIYSAYLDQLGLAISGANDSYDKIAFGKAGLSYATFGYYAKERQAYGAGGSAGTKTLAADAFYGLGNEGGVEMGLADFQSNYDIQASGATFEGKTVAVLNVGAGSREISGTATLNVAQSGDPTLDLAFADWYNVHYTAPNAAELEYRTGITTANGMLTKSGWNSNGARATATGGFEAKYYGDGNAVSEAAGLYDASGAAADWAKDWQLNGAFGAKTATPVAKM